jgi:hypothetical protein
MDCFRNSNVMTDGLCFRLFVVVSWCWMNRVCIGSIIPFQLYDLVEFSF